MVSDNHSNNNRAGANPPALPFPRRDMKTYEPAALVPATCETCHPWVRMVPTPTMHLVRQELHEPHCSVVPKMQRAAV